MVLNAMQTAVYVSYIVLIKPQPHVSTVCGMYIVNNKASSTCLNGFPASSYISPGIRLNGCDGDWYAYVKLSKRTLGILPASFLLLPVPERPGKDRFGGEGLRKSALAYQPCVPCNPFPNIHHTTVYSTLATTHFGNLPYLPPFIRPIVPSPRAQWDHRPQYLLFAVCLRLLIAIYCPSILSNIFKPHDH